MTSHYLRRSPPLYIEMPSSSNVCIVKPVGMETSGGHGRSVAFAHSARSAASHALQMAHFHGWYKIVTSGSCSRMMPAQTNINLSVSGLAITTPAIVAGCSMQQKPAARTLSTARTTNSTCSQRMKKMLYSTCTCFATCRVVRV